MNNVSLYSVTPDTGGIFSALDSFSVPWKNTVNAELIDLQYYGNVSGEKIISPLVYKNLTEGKLTETKQALIASMIFSMFGTNWTKEWNTLSMQYDPIANYDMTETMTDDETVTEYGKTHTKTGTETDAPNLTVSTSDTVHGFNSSNAVPTDARSQGTSGSDITTYDTSDTDSGEDTQTRNYELTRKGNIGVTSSQQLLESERNLWMWNYFLDVVFPDVDKILTIPIYADPEEYTENGFVPTGTISINENGLQIDVKQYAFADVAVPNSYTVDDQGKVVYGDLLIGQTSRTITENGEYDTTLNNDCTVNVPNTYTLSDEGKVVSSGALVSQTSRTVTENDTYDTTTNNSVIVNVPIGINVLHDDNEPSLQDGNNGDIYLKTKKFLTYDSELNFSCSEEYYVNSTTQKLSQISTAFYKTVAGGCIAVYYHNTAGYYGPLLISTVQDYVKYTQNTSPDANRYVTIDGVNWYYSTTNYWSRSKDTTASIPLFDQISDDITNDIPYILEKAFYRSGNVENEYHEVIDSYIKSNNIWSDLIGYVIHI